MNLVLETQTVEKNEGWTYLWIGIGIAIAIAGFAIYWKLRKAKATAVVAQGTGEAAPYVRL